MIQCHIYVSLKMIVVDFVVERFIVLEMIPHIPLLFLCFYVYDFYKCDLIEFVFSVLQYKEYLVCVSN